MSRLADTNGPIKTTISRHSSPRYHHQAGSSISSPPNPSDTTLTSVNGKRPKSISSISSTSSPRKKASPSDVIFGKPPGSDLASRVYESLNADGSSSSGSSGGIPGVAENSKKISPLRRSDDNGASNGETSTDGSNRSEAVSTGTSLRTVEGKSSLGMDTEHEGIKIVPNLFEEAEADDIVVLVADMLTRLTIHNDQLPLHPTSLTRFHSRATPSISILSYLKRITKYTSLEKSCTLILLIYIDRVCERISGFTICSLTVHRFICAAVVCASKALCDSFSTNGHYARVGGISLIELNMLEKEFLNIINWKLSCSGALLQHYYTSLVESHQSYELKIVEGSLLEAMPNVKDLNDEVEMEPSSNS